MKVAELLKKRRQNWYELEQLCGQLEERRRRAIGAVTISRFAQLYRAACADLALADAYQIPPNTVQYLHRLVGRAHNQFYRSREFDTRSWAKVLLSDVPQRIFNDRCVQVAFVLFWGTFMLSAALASSSTVWPDFAEQVLSAEQIAQLEDNFADPIQGRNATYNPVMAGFYIRHNTSIGLQCFAGGLLVIPGLLMTLFNAVHLGASFGYMARPDVPEGINFFHFVTAHGPFEITAIVLSAGAGLRLGYSWICSQGMERFASLQKTAFETMPLMGAAMVMFVLAAIIEGFLSPSAAPYGIKAALAVLSSGLLTGYFVLLGFPQQRL